MQSHFLSNFFEIAIQSHYLTVAILHYVLLSRTITKPSNIVIHGSSQTLPTDKQDVIEDEIPCQGKRHAVRSITFGGAPCTPKAI
jgi:hypothetical protein